MAWEKGTKGKMGGRDAPEMLFGFFKCQLKALERNRAKGRSKPLLMVCLGLCGGRYQFPRINGKQPLECHNGNAMEAKSRENYLKLTGFRGSSLQVVWLVEDSSIVS